MNNLGERLEFPIENSTSDYENLKEHLIKLCWDCRSKYKDIYSHNDVSTSFLASKYKHIPENRHLPSRLETSLSNTPVIRRYQRKVFFDLKKDFDAVDFSILQHRVEFIGIIGSCLKWLESYLCGRFNIIIDDAASVPFPVACGVPEGSVLAPLLYLVYVDTMRFYLPYACLTSFAD